MAGRIARLRQVAIRETEHFGIIRNGIAKAIKGNITVKRRMLLFNWSDRLVAAYSISGAKRIIRERFGSTRGSKMLPVTGRIAYHNEDGKVLGKVSGQNCGSVWPKPMLVPEWC